MSQAPPVSGYGKDQAPYWKKFVVNGTGATVVSANPCVYGGYEVVGAAGANTMDIYDSASAASGQKVAAAISVAAAAKDRLADGIAMDNGIVVNLSGDPTDAQILIFYR